MAPTTTVGGGNLPPIAVDDVYATTWETTLTVPAPGVLANDRDPNGDPLTAGMPTNPANGTLNLSTNGGFTYTPNPGFAGSDTWTYMAHDPFGGMTTATVTIMVTAPPLPTTSTTTLAPTTTVAPTTTTSPGACVPGQGGAKPGYGKGDQNHVHCGPPGQMGGRGGGRAAMNGRPVTSTRPLPVWLIAGVGILFLSSLVIPFRRMRGEHSTKR